MLARERLQIRRETTIKLNGKWNTKHTKKKKFVFVGQTSKASLHLHKAYTRSLAIVIVLLPFTLCFTHVVSFFRHMSHNMWPLFFRLFHFFLLAIPWSRSLFRFSPSIIHYPNTKRLKLIKTLTFCRRSTFTFLSQQ